MLSWYCTNCAATVCWRVSVSAERDSLTGFSTRSSGKGVYVLWQLMLVVIYAKFCFRYAILAPKAIPAGFMDGRKAVELLLEALQLETNEYRLGYSKVFFRAGVLGRLEDLRDERLAKIITQFQAFLRGFMMRRLYRKLQDQRLAIAVIQRNVRKHLFLRDWKWWKLYTKVRNILFRY